MLVGAIIGGIIGVLVLVFAYFLREQRFNKILRSLGNEPLEYAAQFNYASAGRYRNSWKYYDSYGALYVIGKTAYYKSSETAAPVVFNLDECTVQAESEWRKLKWFSITRPGGEKFYFNSNKMGAFVNNSDETLKALAVIQAKKNAG
jgi:hypothetical protein